MTTGSMASGWYYSKWGAPAGQQTGPLAWEHLCALAQAGTLTPGDLVWNPQLPQWLPAAQIAGLFPAVAAGAVQAPHPESAQAGTAYGQATRPAAARSRGGRRSWLYWVVPLVVLIVAGAGLGAYFGLRGGGSPQLRFDGVYVGSTYELGYGGGTIQVQAFLRFFEDGTVVGVAWNKGASNESMFKLLGGSDFYLTKGTYQLSGTHLTCSGDQFGLDGTVGSNSLDAFYSLLNPVQGKFVGGSARDVFRFKEVH